jgi:hypothetical protein
MPARNFSAAEMEAGGLFPRWAINGAASLAAGLAVVYILVFAILGWLRMFYPYELEWIEGAFIDEARWISAGHFPYGPPSIHFLPTSKTPLFFYLAAGLMKVLGPGALAPRLISVLATCGCFGLLSWIVWQESRVAAAGVAAAGVFAASYRFAGAWMDLAKTDALLLFLLLAAVACALRWRGSAGMVAAGFLLALAYFTKQLALPVGLALAPVSLAATRGRSWPWWAVAGGTGLAAVVAFDHLSAGWFTFYTFSTSIHHERLADAWAFWRTLLLKFWPAFLLAAWYAGSILSQTRLLRLEGPETAWQLLGFGAALILASWSISIKTWTYENGYLPACLGLALLAGLACGNLARRARPALAFSAWALLILQLGLLAYNPVAQLPSRQDRQAASAFVQRLASLPGEVFLFNHGYYSFLAGKTTYLHSAPYGDVIGAANLPTGSDLDRRRELVRSVYRQAVAGQIFEWVIVDKPAASWTPYYLLVEDLGERVEFYPVTGARTRPLSLMARNPVARGGDLPLDDPTYDPWFETGWGGAEPGGRRVTGARAAVRLALETDRDYELGIELEPACLASVPALATLGLGWNQQQLGSLDFPDCRTRWQSFEIAAGAVLGDTNHLWLEIQPGSVGEIADDGYYVRVRRIRFTQK